MDIVKYSGHNNTVHTAKQSKSLRLMTERCAVVNPMHLVLIFPTICIPHIFSVHYVTLDITPLLPREGLSEFSPLSFLGWWRRWYLLIAQTPASQTLWSLPFISYWGYNLVPISARCLDTNHSRKNIYIYISWYKPMHAMREVKCEHMRLHINVSAFCLSALADFFHFSF